MKQTILCFAFLCAIAVTQDAWGSTRLNNWTAINVGLAALKAKYPKEYRDLVLRYRPFVAKFEEGVWQVHGTKFVAGGSAPEIDVRDRDKKILKIDLRG